MTRPLVTRALGAAIVGTLCAGVVAIAAEPTGAATPAGVVPSSSRLADDVTVDGVHVLLVSTDEDRLAVLVAYRGRKGWLAVEPSAAPPAVQTAWTTTAGAGPVPALTMSYGQTQSPRVRVQWSDGRVSDVAPEPDGSWLAVRPGQLGVERVELLDAAGHVVSSVTAP